MILLLYVRFCPVFGTVFYTLVQKGFYIIYSLISDDFYCY